MAAKKHVHVPRQLRLFYCDDCGEYYTSNHGSIVKFYGDIVPIPEVKS